MTHTSPQRLLDLIHALDEDDRATLVRLLESEPLARDTNREYVERLTFGQRLADTVAAFGGSWTFILLFALLIVAWMAANSARDNVWDPYPFILLNLVLSTLAAVQAPVILMSQNRQAATDRLASQHDYEVNLKAEMEITTLQAKLDELREVDWQRLIELQQEQLTVLKRLDERLAALRPDRPKE